MTVRQWKESHLCVVNDGYIMPSQRFSSTQAANDITIAPLHVCR